MSIDVVTLVLSVIAGAIYVGRKLQAVDTLAMAVDRLTVSVNRLESKLDDHDARLAVVEDRTKQDGESVS